MALNTLIDFFIEKFCCCFNGSKNDGSDDDQVNVQSTVLCCVSAKELHIIDMKDFEDSEDDKDENKKEKVNVQ